MVSDSMRKRVLIINTGGTIGMRTTATGYRPEPGFLLDQMRRIPELADPAMPEYVVDEFSPVIDSANMTPADWQRIAGDIELAYDRFDGFLILHGTDTMAFTASALAFMLGGLAKSVVVTGSQLPLCELRNDARENLMTAMMLASQFTIPEVTIFFGSRLLRGCRATKASTSLFEAFDSPNYPPLGTAGTHLEVFHDRIRPIDPARQFQLHELASARIATMRLFPGVCVDVLRHSLDQPLDALVLQSFGVGNGPSNDPAFVQVLQGAVDRGVTIVNLTQCHQGQVAMGQYATGSAMAEVGVVSGGDMTFEATVAKLRYLLGKKSSLSELREAIGRDLVGELTISDQVA